MIQLHDLLEPYFLHINMICSLAMFFSMIYLLTEVLPRKKAEELNTNVSTLLLRFGMICIALGSISNVAILSIPPWSELVLNVGLAAFFVWQARHYNLMLYNELRGDVA